MFFSLRNREQQQFYLLIYWKVFFANYKTLSHLIPPVWRGYSHHPAPLASSAYAYFCRTVAQGRSRKFNINNDLLKS